MEQEKTIVTVVPYDPSVLLRWENGAQAHELEFAPRSVLVADPDEEC